MKRVSSQGLQLSASQRRRLALQKLVKPTAFRVADPADLEQRFPAFVGPYAPHVPDLDAEARAYWRLVRDFQRFGRLIPEESFRGAPFCGDRDYSPQEYTA